MSPGAAARVIRMIPRAPSPSVRRPWHRPGRLPATGMPAQREHRRRWTILSIVIHIAIIVLVTMDWESHERFIIEKPQGAGGPGPAGGGGGGRRGTGGSQERVQYVRVTPPPAPAPQATVLPPVVPQPQVVPPPAVKPPEVTPELKLDIKTTDSKATEPMAPTVEPAGWVGLEVPGQQKNDEDDQEQVG